VLSRISNGTVMHLCGSRTLVFHPGAHGDRSHRRLRIALFGRRSSGFQDPGGLLELSPLRLASPFEEMRQEVLRRRRLRPHFDARGTGDGTILPGYAALRTEAGEIRPGLTKHKADGANT
jgi:hypothetical protein